ncbi:serine hydrolase domain-containing protein [Streptomyces sp. ITFR-16]|uniref:serine hydrolase domain-containing protein n=1 Tax=Streptomyces sp. ITFR-16 TaxID=3075198 RepID=UPI0028897888|nr:serine hydrolase domain-containing protein [Streptomyces sp. ITFR-16]WNI26670.1 serine hydrolase domain-containing protein [Streptomyces sp. ITFR-16]
MPLPSPLRIRVPLAALLAAACMAGPVHAPALAAELPAGHDLALSRQLRELTAAPGGPPGVIAVLRRGPRTEVYRAGVAETGTDRPIEVTDHMRIASTAKAYSGAVALQLVDRGRLRPDDTIGKVLPRLPRAWHRVTLRQLLNHTSGLPDYSAAPPFLKLLTADPRRHFDSRRLLDFVAGRPTEFRPGTRYRYSNSDNIAVALMAEAVTGRRYEDLLARSVYHPLGLRGTSLPQGYRMPAPYMHGYDVTPPNPPEDVSEVLSASGVWASGGIISTPKDMTAFVRGYAGGRLISERTRRQQLTWVNGASEPAGPGRNSAGLGIFRYATRCGTVYGHTGNFPGYTQLIAADRDGKRSLTFSLTTQVNQTNRPALLQRLRTVEENFVCALLRKP